jgi:hypothetical protein
MNGGRECLLLADLSLANLRLPRVTRHTTTTR